jgi:hypothetical protein
VTTGAGAKAAAGNAILWIDFRLQLSSLGSKVASIITMDSR